LASVDADVYEFKIPENGIRYADTAGITNYVPDADSTRTFTMAGAEEGEVKVAKSSDSPEEAIELVSESSDTEGIELLVFELQAKVTAVTVDEIDIDVTATGTTDDASDIVSAVKLYSGTSLIGTETLDEGDPTVTFADLDLDIAKDAKKTLTVKVDVLELDDEAAYEEGDSIAAAFSGIYAEDASDNEIDDVWTGAADGEDMYLYTVAPELTLTSASLSTTRTETIEEADGTLVFKVKALGGDVYVDFDGVLMDETAGTGTYDVVVTGATETEDNWKIAEDATATFTVDILIAGDVDGDSQLVRAWLDDLQWNADDDDAVYNGVPASLIEDFETPAKSLKI